jgi:hypothetical protein
MNIKEFYNEIEKIEMSPGSVVGGSKAFFSGYKTELTDKAKAKIAKLQKEIDKLEGAYNE